MLPACGNCLPKFDTSVHVQARFLVTWDSISKRGCPYMLSAIQAILGNTGNTGCDFVVTHISWSTLSHQIIHILVASAVLQTGLLLSH